MRVESNRAQSKVRLNRNIRVPEVRLIDQDGEQCGVVTTAKALQMAEEAQLDLVEISPNAAPPVCRILDYGKFLFEQSKKQAVAKKKQRQTQVKEIKFRPSTEEGDYQVKLRKLIAFLEQGDKTKVTIRFRGREIAHRDLGMKLVERVKADLEEYGIVEQNPKFEGRQLVLVLAPKKRS